MLPKPKKRLGQNFLIDANIRSKIVDACGLKKSDTVLEIGAGRGELTCALAERVACVYAVELDHRLHADFQSRFNKQKNVNLIRHDILELDLLRMLGAGKKKIKVIGNIPYYITTAIITHLLEFREMIDTIFISVQKEFAERITASSGSKVYGSFSCFINYYFLPQILFHIKKSSFRPAPKVDSSFLSLKVRKEPAVKCSNPQLLFKIIRTAFNQRRKTLRNSLKEAIPKEKLEGFMQEYGIDPNTRPERLSLQDFSRLTDSL
ncbi:16S rRNA (adenine(1518)-N(6)/adenine(1519)-N(6))-dimethyltransferase RsmA [Candidatus Omnitrophota bacterium]